MSCLKHPVDMKIKTAATAVIIRYFAIFLIYSTIGYMSLSSAKIIKNETMAVFFKEKTVI